MESGSDSPSWKPEKLRWNPGSQVSRAFWRKSHLLRNQGLRTIRRGNRGQTRETRGGARKRRRAKGETDCGVTLCGDRLMLLRRASGAGGAFDKLHTTTVLTDWIRRMAEGDDEAWRWFH